MDGFVIHEYNRPKIARNRYNYLRRRTKYRSAGGGNVESTYYTGTNTNIGDYITKNLLSNILKNYLLKKDYENQDMLDLSTFFGNYVTTELLYSEYYNKADIDIRFAKLAGNESGEIDLDAYVLKNELVNYYSKEEVDDLLAKLKAGDFTDAQLERILDFLGNDYVSKDLFESLVNRYITLNGVDKAYVNDEIDKIRNIGYVTEEEVLTLIENLTGVRADFLTKEEADNYYQPKGDYITYADIPTFEDAEGGKIEIKNYLSKAEAERDYMKKVDLTSFFYSKDEVNLLKDNMYDYINENFAIGAKVGDSDPVYTDASKLINLDELLKNYIDSSQFIQNLYDSSVWNNYLDTSFSGGTLDISTLEDYLKVNNYKKIIQISQEDYDALEEVENDVVYLIDGLYCTCNGSTGEGTGEGLNETLIINLLKRNNYKKIIQISQEDYDNLSTKDLDAVYLINGLFCTCNGEGGTGGGSGSVDVDLSNYYTKAEVDALIPDINDVDLTDYYTKSEVDALIPEEVNLSNYYTKAEVDLKFEDYDTEVNSWFDDYDKLIANANNRILDVSSKVNNVSTRLNNYYTKAEVDALIPEETDLSDYYTKSEVDALIPTDYYTKAEVDVLIPKSIDSSLSDYYTKYEIDNDYVTKNGFTTYLNINYYDKGEVALYIENEVDENIKDAETKFVLNNDLGTLFGSSEDRVLRKVSEDYVDKTTYNTKMLLLFDTSNNHKHTLYIDKSSTSALIMKAHFLLGDLNTTDFKQFAAWRKCPNNITGSNVNTASFYVNSDGTAAFFHKTTLDNGTSAVADAILKFYWGGLYFAAAPDGRTTASEFKKVATEDYVDSKFDDSLDLLLNVLNRLT